MLFDLHIHSNKSDGRLSPEDIASQARARGIKAGLTDHVLCFHFLATEGERRSYLEATAANGLYTGVEVDIGRKIELPDFFIAGLDYIIGSVHHVVRDGADVLFAPYFRSRAYGEPYNYPANLGDPRALLDEIAGLIDVALSNEPIDILGHVTALPAREALGGDKEAFCRDWCAGVVRSCVRNGVALELSGLWKAPHHDMVEIALEEGAMFSTGSDAHNQAGLFDLAYPAEAISRFGIPEERLFAPLAAPPRIRLGR